MSHDPQSRYEEALALDARVDDAERQGLTGTARGDVYEPTTDPDDVTRAPDGRPMAEQPKWRRDFPIDWGADQYVARRDFAKFLVLTSGAFVAGQGWIVAQDIVRKNRKAPGRARIAAISDLAIGEAKVFPYPEAHDPCLLIRLEEDLFVAYGQECTHLACAVVPRVSEGVLHCPCHAGYFDLRTGNVLSGPPPRPLRKILLEVEDGAVYAIGVEDRTG